MKCPGCLYVCSDLRDICPRCYTDLRPHKKQLHLPISNARASYDELLSKIAPTKAAPKPATAQHNRAEGQSESPRKSLSGTLRNLWGAFARASTPAGEIATSAPPPKDSTPAPEPPFQTAPPTQPSARSPEVELDHRSQETLLGSELTKELEGLTPKGPEVLDFSQFDEKVEGIIDRILGDSEIVAHEGASAKARDYDEFEIEIVEELPEDDEIPLGESAPPKEAEVSTGAQLTPTTPAPEPNPAPESIPEEQLSAAPMSEQLEDEGPIEVETEIEYPADSSENLPHQIDFSEEEEVEAEEEIELTETLQTFPEQEQEQSADTPASTQFSHPDLSAAVELPETDPIVFIDQDAPSDPISPPEELFEKLREYSSEVQDPAPPSVSEPAPTPAPAIPAPIVIDPALVEIMFGRVQEELEEHALEAGSEINLHQLVDLSNREDINLYFDLTHDAILNPEAEKIFDENFTSSLERKVESEAVVKYHLSTIESMISAPVLSLKSAALKARELGKRRSAQEDQPFRLASRRERVLAGVVDCFAVLCAVSLLTLLYFVSARSSAATLPEFDLTHPLAALPYVSVFSALLVLFSFLYPLLSFCSASATLGMLNIGTRLAREDGKRLRFRNAFVHAALTPLYLVSFGFLAPLIGAKGFTEKLARTRMVHFETAARGS